jgi:hypothetical protein
MPFMKFTVPVGIGFAVTPVSIAVKVTGAPATLSWMVAFRKGLIWAMMPSRSELKAGLLAKAGWNTPEVVGRSCAAV